MENEIKYRPILFSTPMVQAINGGRKNQTRREVKPMSAAFDVAMNKDGSGKWPRNLDEDERWISDMKCPYGKVGDVLWVRETWIEAPEQCTWKNYSYKADYNSHLAELGKWKPSIHMPKSACRIFLQITNIRLERLQDINEDDAIMEGVLKDIELPMPNFKKELFYRDYTKETSGCSDAKSSFMTLWKSINGKESWDSNPWVWVIEFEKIEKPEDWK